MKQQVLGRETIQEVELEEGRGHPGQKSWILKFRGIDTVDQVKASNVFLRSFFVFLSDDDGYVLKIVWIGNKNGSQPSIDLR